jgi:iron complex outermembrane receptor protein
MDPYHRISPEHRPKAATGGSTNAEVSMTANRASLASRLGITLLCASPAGFSQALAQSAPQSSPTDTGLVAEVIVTAQKREQRLQDVPVTVSVVGGEELTKLNISDLASLQRAAPALQMVGGGSGALQIRGIGTVGYSSTSEPSVAVVLDGVVLSRMPAGGVFNGGLFDIQRVEVLSGPQGTLFGKNSSAGVVNIVTNPPQIGETEFIAHAEGGDRGYRLAQATANLPLGETAALRLSGNYREQSDIYYNTFRGPSHDWSGGARAKLLWKPLDDLTVNIIGDYQSTDSNGVALVVGPIRKVGSGTVLESRLLACGVTAGPENNRQCAQSSDSRNGFFTPNASYGGSVQLDYDFNDYTLTSITSERGYDYGDRLPSGTEVNDGDNTSLPLISSNIVYGRTDTFSQELRLTTPAGRFIEAVAGLYYWDFDAHYVGDISGTLGAALPAGQLINRYNDTQVDSSSRAVFGQLTLNATDDLRFIAGARYTDETLKEVLVPGAAPGFILLPSFQLRAVNQTVDTDNFSWRLGAQYDINDDVMAFVTATRGYKGPQINELTPTSIAPEVVRPEIPMNYEIGLKASLFDRRLVANITAFHQKVKNFQTNVFIPSATSGTITTFATGNAPYVLSKGVDLNIFGRPMTGLEINLGILYNDATYSPDFIVACKQGSAAGCLTTSVENVVFSPDWKVRMSADYSMNLAASLQMFVGADVNYATGFNYSSTPDPALRAPSYTVLGARVGVRTDDERFGVYVFGRNLADKRIPTMIAADSSGASNGGAGQSYTQNLSIDSYRMIGLALDARF